jgi:nitrate/nitrite transport system ATP-binding protein
MSHLELRNVSKTYGTTEVLANINLSIEEGEFVALIGFSGSGKTTLISILAGLIEPDAGEVILRGKPANSVGPGPDRGVVFQSYSLMPWLTVFENVALAVDTVRWRARSP